MRTSLHTLQSVLCSSAREAANSHEASSKRVATRQETTLETALPRVPTRYVALMRGVAEQCSSANGQGVTLASLFSPEAYEVLCRRSASPFYFWRIVAQAAELTTALPMQVADIERGIAETRYRWLIGTALGQAMMNTAIPSAARSTPADRQKMLLEGFMVARLGSTFDAADHSTMEANPLFA